MQNRRQFKYYEKYYGEKNVDNIRKDYAEIPYYLPLRKCTEPFCVSTKSSSAILPSGEMRNFFAI
jgi:hypothetical protein